MPTAGPESTPWATQLYDDCAAKMILYGRALGLGHGEAEDVLHDTFQALLRLVQPPEEPRLYLVRSFRNRALNHRRSLWRRLARELESKRWFEPAERFNPAEEAAQRALAELPAAQREVIVLKIWHQLTFEVIGGILQISPNTAAGRYRYGLRKLRHTLLSRNHDPDRRTGSPSAWFAAAPTPSES